jgi:hypothetical protein
MVSAVLACLSSVISAPALAGDLVPGTVDFPIRAAFIPDGFDSNDNAQLVIEGEFPNTCYRPSTPKVTVDEASRTITVEAQAYFYEGFCLQILVPFDQTVDLGILTAGKYSVIQKVRLGGYPIALGALNVRRATHAGADDYLYAPVSQIFLDQSENRHRLVLTGEFTNSCLRLADVKIGVQPKVLVLQPVAELSSRTDCVDGKFPFQRVVELGDVPHGRYLIHVRTLNGKALNQLADFRN